MKKRYLTISDRQKWAADRGSGRRIREMEEWFSAKGKGVCVEGDEGLSVSGKNIY